MGLFGIGIKDLAGSFGISTTGILSGALKLVGVSDKTAHAIGLAAELSRGMTKDGFDWNKVNKGALVNHALHAFGVEHPSFVQKMALTAGLGVVTNGFSKGSGLGLGTLMGGMAAGGLASSALGSLSGQQLGIGALLTGIVGGAGFGGPGDIAGSIPKFLFGNKTSEMRGLLGMTRSQGGPGSMMSNLPRPAYFEDIVAAFMIDVVKDKQEDIEGRLKELDKKDQAKKTAGGQMAGQAAGTVASGANQAAQDGNSDSRNIQFEIIKNEIQKLTEMQQAMSNVLNTMHEQAQGAIRNIKA